MKKETEKIDMGEASPEGWKSMKEYFEWVLKKQHEENKTNNQL